LKSGKKSSPDYREKKEYLKIWNFNYSINNVSCNYDGVCRMKNEEIELVDFKI